MRQPSLWFRVRDGKRTELISEMLLRHTVKSGESESKTAADGRQRGEGDDDDDDEGSVDRRTELRC